MKFWKREVVSPEEQERRTALKEAEQRLKEASREYENRVKTSQKAVDEAEKDHAQRIKQIEKRISAAQASKKLGSFAKVTLFEDRITTPDGTSSLSNDVRADCDTAGNLEHSSRVTATRLLTVGIFAFAFKKKKTHDSRELYLVVETPDFTSVQPVDPSNGPQARKFATQIANQSKQATALIERRRAAVATARSELARVKSDRSQIEEAAAQLRAVQGETSDVDRLRAEVEGLTNAPV